MLYPQDFSEDTYRTLAAADNAVMLVDAAKGLEPQTRKLFEVRRCNEIISYCRSLLTLNSNAPI